MNKNTITNLPEKSTSCDGFMVVGRDDKDPRSLKTRKKEMSGS